MSVSHHTFNCGNKALVFHETFSLISYIMAPFLHCKSEGGEEPFPLVARGCSSLCGLFWSSRQGRYISDPEQITLRFCSRRGTLLG